MITQAQLKTQGLAFGRSLQTALKTVMMYAIDHPAAEKTFEQTFNSLNNLVKQTQQFTIGFTNERVLVNNILTDDSSLSQLETEFTKRGIAAVTFVAGVTLRDFKRALALLATKPQVIEEKGGTTPFLNQNLIEGVRILPIKKPAKGEDTVLGMDSESYLLAEGLLGTQAGAAVGSLDLLCEFAGVERPAGFAGSAAEILDLAGKATQATLVNPEADPRGLVTSLARMLQDLTPAYVLSALPPPKQEELRGRPVQEVATDLLEDMTVGTAVKQLTAPAVGSLSGVQEEEVARFLFRGLKATRMAERLLNKLSRLLDEAGLPAEVYERIRQGMTWYALSQKDKHDQLMRSERFGPQEFQRLVALVRELLSEGKINEAIQLAEHYFAFLDSAPAAIQTDDLARSPDLLHAMAGLPALQFTHKIAEKLKEKLLDETRPSPEWHRQVVNCLATMARSAAPYEDFDFVYRIGLNLERSLAQDSVGHASCCGTALTHVLTPGAAERLVELFIEKRDDAAWSKRVTSLLKWLGPLGGEKVLQRLEEENAPPRRMLLIRLLSQLGPAGVEPARKRLSDERWYVVRNACRILGELEDPELPEQLRGALGHPDLRVQQAAANAIIKSQAAGRAQVLAESLPQLQGNVVELAVDELSAFKDPSSIEGLEQFILSGKGSKAGVLEKAIRALGSIATEPAAQALARILSNPAAPLPVRRAALEALRQSPVSVSQQLLAEFATHAEHDPLAAEWRSTASAKPPRRKPH